MPPLVPNENCRLKLSRLSSVVTSARSQKSQNDFLILYRLTTPRKLTIKFNTEHVAIFFQIVFGFAFQIVSCYYAIPLRTARKRAVVMRCTYMYSYLSSVPVAARSKA